MVQVIFTKLMSFLGQLSTVCFESKRLNICQFFMEDKKSGIFLTTLGALLSFWAKI